MAKAHSIGDFLNVDVGVWSEAPLKALSAELEKVACVLHSGRIGRKHVIWFETNHYFRKSNPDRTIRSLYQIIKKLSPKARADWKKARTREFDIGFDSAASSNDQMPHMLLQAGISQESLELIAEVGASFAVTCYRREEKVSLKTRRTK